MARETENPYRPSDSIELERQAEHARLPLQVRLAAIGSMLFCLVGTLFVVAVVGGIFFGISSGLVWVIVWLVLGVPFAFFVGYLSFVQTLQLYRSKQPPPVDARGASSNLRSTTDTKHDSS